MDRCPHVKAREESRGWLVFWTNNAASVDWLRILEHPTPVVTKKVKLSPDTMLVELPYSSSSLTGINCQRRRTATPEPIHLTDDHIIKEAVPEVKDLARASVCARIEGHFAAIGYSESIQTVQRSAAILEAELAYQRAHFQWLSFNNTSIEDMDPDLRRAMFSVPRGIIPEIDDAECFFEHILAEATHRRLVHHEAATSLPPEGRIVRAGDDQDSVDNQAERHTNTLELLFGPGDRGGDADTTHLPIRPSTPLSHELSIPTRRARATHRSRIDDEGKNRAFEYWGVDVARDKENESGCIHATKQPRVPYAVTRPHTGSKPRAIFGNLAM
ncbi:unnamed protein product [Mycena citricolor]|uniref:Uncharacterized protein n=1 Tax=Mycena citricolor TaxID=2018698 RepID=A0AAD2HHN1_9AGAR|nr:unnamed protein product [Mycena citricolor]